MNFVKHFYTPDFKGYEGTSDAINEFAKENGVEPISISATSEHHIMVVFAPIDYSNQEGKKE